MKDTQMSLFKAPKSIKKTSTKRIVKHRSHKKYTSKHYNQRQSKKRKSKSKKRTLKRTSIHKVSRATKPKEHKRHINKKTKTKEQPRRDKQSPRNNPPVLSIADKAYQQLVNAKLATKCRIFRGGKPCESIALSYCSPNQIHVPLGESMNKVCSRSRHTKPYCYYHYINHHFIMYNGWLMNQIYKYRDDIK